MNIVQTSNDIVAREKSSRNNNHQPSNVSFEKINKPEQLYNICDEWERLADQFQNPLLSYNWFLSCIKALCPPDNMNVFVLRSNGNIKAIAPLRQIKKFGVNRLEILGTPELMEPTALLADDVSSFENLFNALLDLKKPLFLKRLILKPSLRQNLNQLAKKKSYFVIKNCNTSQWIPIESSWENFEKQMRSSQRSRVRRFHRRLEKSGKVEIEVHSENSDSFKHALDEAFRIEASGWKAKERTAILLNKQLEEFFKNYISSALQAGILRLFLLKVNGIGIAMIIGVEYAQYFWTLKIGYDESWSRFAPGIILHHESIRWAFEQQLKGYEFLGTTEPWIETWTENEHIYYTYRLFPKSLHGLLCLGIEGIHFLFKKISGSIPHLSKKTGKK